MILLVRLFCLSILLASWLDTTLGDSSLGLVSRRNRARTQAAVAYQAGRYADALPLYRYIIDTSPTPSLAERVNLGQVHFQLKNYKAAKREFEQTGANPTPNLLSVAASQLGMLACLEKDTATALSQFQKALLNNPDNTAARQNYELLKTRFSGKKAVKKQAQQSPEPTPQPQARQGQRADSTDQQRDRLDRFRNASMSEQQARQLLDALQADDLPYELARRRSRPGRTDVGRW